jgi:hypothetical protein
MTIDVALVKEQGVRFAVFPVKRHVLDSPSEREAATRSYQALVPAYHVIHLGEGGGRARYYGRADIVSFLSAVSPSRLPWRRRTVS